MDLDSWDLMGDPINKHYTRLLYLNNCFEAFQKEKIIPSLYLLSENCILHAVISFYNIQAALRYILYTFENYVDKMDP